MQLPSCPATLESRYFLETATQKTVRWRSLARQRASGDVEWFIDFLCFTYDPRKEAKPNHLPFILYPYQRDMLQWLEARYQGEEGGYQQDGLIEKSRDVGATWVILAWLLHKWLFEEGFNALLGSRKEDLVSNGTVSSLFGRLDYLLRRLPKWMLPKGFSFQDNLTRLKLVNPLNGNTIEGESANSQFSRQGRYSIIFMDEGAFWEDLDGAWRAAGDATACRIICSTPNWEDLKFRELRFESGMPVLTIHWRMHPKKDDAWLERQKERKSEMDIQQELEINYNPITSSLVYPLWREIPKGPEHGFVEGWPLYVAIDFGIKDPTAIIWAQRDPASGELRLIDCYSKKGKGADFFVPFITGKIPEYRLEYLNPEDERSATVKLPWPHSYSADELRQIALHEDWNAGGDPIVYGDPAGKQRAQSSGSAVVDILKKYGVHVKVDTKRNDFGNRLESTVLLMRYMKCQLPRCASLDEAMTEARYPEVRSLSRTSEIREPVHNWTSHYRSALEYLCVNLPLRTFYPRFKPSTRSHAYEAL